MNNTIRPRSSTLVSSRRRYRTRKYQGYGDSYDNAIVLSDDESTAEPRQERRQSPTETQNEDSDVLIIVRGALDSEALTLIQLWPGKYTFRRLCRESQCFWGE